MTKKKIINKKKKTKRTGKATTNRAKSEIEKMEKLVAICERIQDISHKIGIKGYSAEQVPTWYYSDCKRFVNYLEEFARDTNVKPSNLTAIMFRGSRRLPVVALEESR